jgi:hypothetical protein
LARGEAGVPLEATERKLWNAFAVLFGHCLSLVSTKLAIRMPRVAGWHMRARDEVDRTMDTALVSALGMGGLYNKRMERIRAAVFGEAA